MWSRVLLGMVGKLCITLSFNEIYVWSVELNPTIVRYSIIEFAEFGIQRPVQQSMGIFTLLYTGIPEALLQYLFLEASYLVDVQTPNDILSLGYILEASQTRASI